MQHFKTLLKKEFAAYFAGYLAYFLFFAYLFASFGGAIYLKGFLAAKDSALFSVFSLQPYVLAFLIPALTMRLWSEEYKSNSAEFLLTLPIKINEIIAAKFCAAMLFSLILVSGLLPIIIYAGCFIELDVLNIFCAYIGLILLCGLFCSFGLFISSLSGNQIVSYSLSIFAFLLSVIVPQSFLVFAYNDFLFAEIGLFDVFYFISFTMLFLFFNKMVIEYRRKKLTVVPFLLMAAAVVANALICWATSALDYKIDLTLSRIYTLKKQSKDVVASIQKPISIDVYAAEDYLQKDYATAYYFEQISRFLRKYKSSSKGIIKPQMHKVTAFSQEETTLLDKGIFATDNPKGGKDYFGAIIKDDIGNEEVITSFLPERQVYLEEDIDRALLKTAFPKLKKNIGLYLEDEQNLDDFEGAALIWENEYQTGLLERNTFQIYKSADLVIVVNPKNISTVFMYALDQYVMSGGNLIVFLDRQTENQLDDINNSPIRLEKILRHWGIELSDSLFDEGEIAEDFTKSPYPLKIRSACAISSSSENLKITPLIKNNDNILAAIVQGEFKSYYEANPYRDTIIGKQMRPFKAQTKHGNVAIVCDADILNEKNWIAPNSPNRDIFGAIESAGNGRFIMALTDYMAGNYVYKNLPENQSIRNISSIGNKLEEQVRNANINRYEELENKENELLPLIWELGDYNYDNMPEIIEFTDEGRELQNLIAEKRTLDYELIRQYNKKTADLMCGLILITPAVETLLLLLIVLILRARKNRKIKEIMHD